MKYRKCPHCKSTKGFRISYEVFGHGTEDRDFKGRVIDATREIVENTDSHTECLSCGKQIPREDVRTDELEAKSVEG